MFINDSIWLQSEKADKLVNGNGKLEEIIVCSNEIAASTAQLVVSSNVKADRESPKLYALIEAKNSVSTATAGLIASARSYLQVTDDQSKLVLQTNPIQDQILMFTLK